MTAPTMTARRRGIIVLVAILLGSGLGGVGCAAQERADAAPSQAAAWRAYRNEVEPILRRVLGESEGLADQCTVERSTAPAPRFGVDLGPTLQACAAGDLSTARQLAHRQIDRVAANDA